jgi:hypothetical protein
MSACMQRPHKPRNSDNLLTTNGCPKQELMSGVVRVLRLSEERAANQKFFSVESAPVAAVATDPAATANASAPQNKKGRDELR